MPEIPATLKPRLQAWWSALDDGTHTIFEAIYMEAPAAVSRAISGGQWVAEGAEPGLAAQLGGGPETDPGELHAQVPTVVPGTDLRLPSNVAVNAPVPISWAEYNASAVEVPGYYTDIYVENPEGQIVGSSRLTNPPLPVGQSAERSFEFQGAAAEGTYNVRVYINAEGIDPGTGVPGPQGLRSAIGAMFVVGMHEQEADRQNDQIWTMAVLEIANSAQSWPPAEAIRRLTEAVNWLAGHDQLTAEEQQIVSYAANWLATTQRREDNDHDSQDEPFRTQLQALSGAGQSVQMGGPTPENRQRLLDALKRFVDALS
jgi:hypothetical protein